MEKWVTIGMSGWRRDSGAINGVMLVPHESLGTNGRLERLVLVLVSLAPLVRGVDRGELGTTSDTMTLGIHMMTGWIRTSDRPSVKVG